MVLVEDQPDCDTALYGRLKGVEDGGGGRVVQAQVIDRDVQRLGRSIKKGRQFLGDRVGGLAAVGQEVEVECGYWASAFGSPVCSRGSSTCTGSGRVAISAASSGSSVRVIRFRSSAPMAPAASTWFFNQSSSPLQ